MELAQWAVCDVAGGRLAPERGVRGEQEKLHATPALAEAGRGSQAPGPGVRLESNLCNGRLPKMGRFGLIKFVRTAARCAPGTSVLALFLVGSRAPWPAKEYFGASLFPESNCMLPSMG